jgi:hypothetical protein
MLYSKRWRAKVGKKFRQKSVTQRVIRGDIVKKITMVTQVVWRIPNQSLPHAETHVRPHIKCPLLLSNFNRNLNVLIHFIKTSKCQISWKSVQPFSSCYVCTDRQTDGRQSDFSGRSAVLRMRLNKSISFQTRTTDINEI